MSKPASPPESSASRAPSSQVEMFMRYDKITRIYEFKPSDTAPSIELNETKAAEILLAFQRDAAQQAQYKVFKFLVDEARKDPKGTWVQASSGPLSDGQARI